jgi:hypothetical protein
MSLFDDEYATTTKKDELLGAVAQVFKLSSRSGLLKIYFVPRSVAEPSDFVAVQNAVEKTDLDTRITYYNVPLLTNPFCSLDLSLSSSFKVSHLYTMRLVD